VCVAHIHRLKTAVLRDISGGTSYQTVRLVFRHYTHLTPSSCTSERLEASTELSSTFTSNMHSSLSFGSHQYIQPLSAHNASMISLVRVTRRAKSNSLLKFTFSFCTISFSHFNRSTSPLSVIPQYLALDRHNHPLHAALPNNTTLLPSKPAYGYLPLYVRTSHALQPAINTHNFTQRFRTMQITIRAHPSSLAATTGILVSFFSSLY